MSTHSTYELLRQLADSWGLIAMGVLFIGLVAWPFRPGAGSRNNEAANMIFGDEDDGQ